MENVFTENTIGNLNTMAETKGVRTDGNNVNYTSGNNNINNINNNNNVNYNHNHNQASVKDNTSNFNNNLGTINFNTYSGYNSIYSSNKIKDKYKKMVYNDIQQNRSSRSGSENKFGHLPNLNNNDRDEN